MDVNWTAQLLEQLTWWWGGHIRPHLVGLSDDEYFWEPVPGMWSVRPRAEARTDTPAGAGDWICDFAFPEPSPVPLTTIAWRLGHVIVGIFGMRNASHFGGPPFDYATYRWPATAADALAALDEVYRVWVEGVAGLDSERLAAPVGPAEGPYAELPYAALVLHINREALHHLAEVLLLRDLYAAQPR
ncbi:MAG TPA: DinB family protein [Acidimicrobiia bacterium]|nr:DinB family protein [Acidimicrobiia bacterium]